MPNTSEIMYLYGFFDDPGKTLSIVTTTQILKIRIGFVLKTRKTLISRRRYSENSCSMVLLCYQNNDSKEIGARKEIWNKTISPSYIFSTKKIVSLLPAYLVVLP